MKKQIAVAMLAMASLAASAQPGGGPPPPCSPQGGNTNAVWLSTNLFVVNLTGCISGPSSNQRISAASLVASNDFLMVGLDAKAGTVQLLEGSGSVTNPVIVQVLLASTRSIVTTNGDFMASLLPAGGAATYAFSSGLTFGGDLFLTGSIFYDRKGVLTLNADLSGIWNDPINGITNTTPALFSGSVTSNQRPKTWRWRR